MYYTNVPEWVGMDDQALDAVLKENQRQVLLHPECLSVTTVMTAKGNQYQFVNTEALLGGAYPEQEGHIQTLIDADDVEVTMVCTAFYPQTPEMKIRPDMPVGYFSQRLITLHPKNAMAMVPGWGGVDKNGEDMIGLSPLQVVTPPKKK